MSALGADIAFDLDVATPEAEEFCILGSKVESAGGLNLARFEVFAIA